jgi:hypothetical protein
MSEAVQAKFSMHVLELEWGESDNIMYVAEGSPITLIAADGGAHGEPSGFARSTA